MALMSATTRAISTPAPGRSGRLQVQRRLEVVELVGDLPGELLVAAAEVTVGGGALVDGPAQVEVADDGGRAEVENLLHALRDLGGVDRLGAERLHHHRDGPGHADG